IHSNDIHGTFNPWRVKINHTKRFVGGMKAASHYIRKIRASEGHVLLIDTGDIMTGTLASHIEYKGVLGGAMIEFLNRLGYNLFSIGNHAFDKGQDNVLKYSQLANYPIIMANIVYKESGEHFPLKPYHIFTVGGLKVGVIAVMEENFSSEVHNKKIRGLDALPIVPTLNSYVPLLDRQTDLIVVCAHTRFKEGLRIAREIPGIDVVLVASEDGRFQNVDGVLVKSTFGHQKTLGSIKLEVEEDKVVSYEEKLIW
ncbi:unnamed protein product, partial [marine sediment metagenome]